MKNISRVIAEGIGKGDFIASGCFGRVSQHGDKRVYKVARLDGTAVWLVRCFAIQKRLGLDHPLCDMMPEIFSYRKLKNYRYEVVMAKYRRVYELGDGRGTPEPALAYSFPGYTVSGIVDAVLGVDEWGVSFSDDLHRGNILYCDKRGWVITDPSCASYNRVSKGAQDPKFNRAKRVVTQYGPQRRQ